MPTTYPCDRRDLVDAVARSCCRRWTRRRPPRCVAAADDAALPRLPHRRARRARGRRLPRQLDLHPLARRRGRPHPELRLVVAVPGEGGPHLPRPRVLRRSRATRSGSMADEDLIALGHARARAPRPRRRRRRSRPATSCGCRRRTRSTTSTTRRTSRACATGSRTRTQRAPGRPQRHAPYNNQDHSMFTAMLTRREHRSARTTTSGRSTSRRSTTRRARYLSLEGHRAKVPITG